MNLLNVTVKQAVVVFTLVDQKEKMCRKWLDVSLSGVKFFFYFYVMHVWNLTRS